MSIDHLNEIEKLTRTKAIYESKSQKWKLDNPRASDLYKNIVIAINNSILFMQTKNREQELLKIKQTLE